MRVWFLESPQPLPAPSARTAMLALSQRPEGGVHLAGSGPFHPLILDHFAQLAVDLVYLERLAWPPTIPLEGFLETGVGLVVESSPSECQRLVTLAARFPVWLLSPPIHEDGLEVALQGAYSARLRQEAQRDEIQRLEQRLADRILVERAKGLLMQRLNISEEEAYRRLRLLSRRQRRQIRELAQSLLDTESLLLPEVNGLGVASVSDEKHMRSTSSAHS